LNEGEDVFYIFLEASQKGGAQPTKTSSVASQFSLDNINWFNIPKGIKVTGKIDRGTTALVLENLEMNNDKEAKIDLWNYSDYLDPIYRYCFANLERMIFLEYLCDFVVALSEELETGSINRPSR